MSNNDLERQVYHTFMSLHINTNVNCVAFSAYIIHPFIFKILNAFWTSTRSSNSYIDLVITFTGACIYWHIFKTALGQVCACKSPEAESLACLVSCLSLLYIFWSELDAQPDDSQPIILLHSDRHPFKGARLAPYFTGQCAQFAAFRISASLGTIM